MARNKYPEITENQILEMSMQLFIDKGYEQTTLQDVADAMGMTRGAIYYHFKNKEEMVDAVTTYMFNKAVPYQKIKENTTFTAFEKIRQIIIKSLSADNQGDTFIALSKTFINNPKLVAAYLDNVRGNVVEMFFSLINEGMEDKSIHVENPQIVAELLSVLLNFWLSPLVFMETKDNFKIKLTYVADILSNIGLPIMDDELLQECTKIIAILPEK